MLNLILIDLSLPLPPSLPHIGLVSNWVPFVGGQGYGGQGAGASPQHLQNKAALSNSLPPFPTELKGAAVTSLPNLVNGTHTHTHTHAYAHTHTVTHTHTHGTLLEEANDSISNFS